MTDYRQCAEECLRLAKLAPKPEDWGHFLEMAQTWEKLASLHELSQRLRSSGVLLRPIQTSLSSSANAHPA